ncbi:hypothetical protein Glove_399g11 [Diversispora epigaea]|uniref:RNase H type-1 domain-containing protein n=1 Tax=Diversispora epigaea TaxID=1348612 RepID=A0A397H887_9GLOM|nr:hypothetical protein Glove_399g11 [Diversispora epigaea]
MLVSKTTTVACGNTCKNMCKTLETLKEFHIPRDVSMRDADHLSFIDVMLGLIPIIVYDIVLQKVVTHDLADQIIDDKVRNETLDTAVTSQTNNTDNNSAFNNTTQTHRKLKNWTIVKAIEEIANVQKLTLRLEKVKAHSGVIHNETADQLAREGCLKPVCYPNLQSLTFVNAVSCWNTETIEESLRHFTKKLGTAKHSIKWRLLNQNISTISAFKSKQIQWKSSWRTTMLSYIDRNVTDNKETRQRAFNVKLFNNELPTLEKLKDRFPKIYENDSCIRCNLEKKDQVHVLTCPKNLIDIHSCRNKFINMLVSKTTTVACGNTCKNMCKTLETLKEFHIPRDVSMRDADHLSFIDVMLGLIPIIVYDIVLQKVVTHDLADQIIDDKVRNETLDTAVTSQTNNTDNNSAFNNTTQNLYMIMLLKIAVIGLGCIK